MEYKYVADHAVDLISAFLTSAADSAGNEAGKRIYNSVAGHLARVGRGSALNKMTKEPSSSSSRSGLASVLINELRTNDIFRRELLSIMRCSDAKESHTTVIDASGNRKSTVVASSGPVSFINKKVNIGGVAVPVVALIVTGAIVLLGIGGISFAANGSSMDENTTCREWLGADRATQAEVMKDLYLASGNAAGAADPFIVENTQYTCGRSPDLTLGRLVD